MDDVKVYRARCEHGRVRAAAMAGHTTREAFVGEVLPWAKLLDEVSLDQAREWPVGCATCQQAKRFAAALNDGRALPGWPRRADRVKRERASDAA